MLKCFSTFADVYYNNQLFRPKKKNFGLKEIRIKAPSRKYDLCYVRGNATIFNKCPKPKIWMAVPYEKGIFARAIYVKPYPYIHIGFRKMVNRLHNITAKRIAKGIVQGG